MTAMIDIWADLSDGQVVKITTRGDMRTHSDYLREGYLRDPKKNRVMLHWFLTRQPWSLEEKAQQILDELFEDNLFSDRDSVQSWLDGHDLGNFFLRLDIDGVRYLKDRQGTLRRPEDFLTAAERMVRTLEPKVQGEAMARIALNCMVLSRLPEQLPDNLQGALLKPWENQDKTQYPLTDGYEFTFGWENLPEGKPLTPYLLKNPEDRPLTIRLNTQKYGTHTICIPPNGRLAAWFIGTTMTCIRGCMSANGRYVACLQQNRIRKYQSPKNTPMSESYVPGGVYEIALDLKGRPHILQDSTLTLSGGDQIPNAMGICVLNESWVAHKKDGSTDSNNIKLRKSDSLILAMVQTEKTILLLERGGKVHSLDGREYSPQDVWEQMIGNFTGLPDKCAERLIHKGREFLLSDSGVLSVRDHERR